MAKQGAIECFVNGRVVSYELIGPPAMNYGQLHRWKHFKQVRYEYVMAVPEFIDRVSPWFTQYCDELKADCKITAPDEDTPEHDFAGLGYPRIDRLLRNHPALAIKLFLSLSLELNNIFAPKTSRLVRFATNSVDGFSRETGKIRFGGVAFDMQSKNQYHFSYGTKTPARHKP